MFIYIPFSFPRGLMRLIRNKVIKTNLIDKQTMLHKEKAKDIIQEFDDDFSDEGSDED